MRASVLVACALLLGGGQAAANHYPMSTGASASDVGSTEATLRGGGFYSATGAEPASCVTHFEYGTTTAYGTTTPAQPTCSATQKITGLTPNTTYHFRAVVTDHSGQGQTYYSQDTQFTTKAAGDKTCSNASAPPPDSDGDRVPDCRAPGQPPDAPVDNCPTVKNFQQADRDKDGVGNACDAGRAQVPAGARTFERTLGAGESISTGSRTSHDNPIVVKLTAGQRSSWAIDLINNPDRPGKGGDQGEGGDTGNNWYGPAVRISATDVRQNYSDPQWARVEYTIDGSAYLGLSLFGGPERLVSVEKAPGQFGTSTNLIHCGGDAANAPTSLGKPAVKYLSGGDVRVISIMGCNVDADAHGGYFESHFYNPDWSIDRREGTSGPRSATLTQVLSRGLFEMNIACRLRCEKKAVARIRSSSAEQLGLKSNVIARGSIGEFYKGERKCPTYARLKVEKGAPSLSCFVMELAPEARKKLRRVKKITVKFTWTAKGPKAGMKGSGSPSMTLKRADDEEDDLG